jgi:hypothetical protein
LEDTQISASEIYDFVNTITADYNYAIGITPQGVVSEESAKNGIVHMGADGSEERIAFGTASIFYITIGWNILSESNSGTIFDWYNDPAKANGMQRSFKYVFGDGHTYVVRFASDLSRVGQAVSRWGLPSIRLRVLGRIADA